MIFFILLKKSSLYDYADDNTLSYSHPDLLETKNVPTSDSEYVIEYFGTNHMRAILESAWQLSWIREGNVTMRASQYMIKLKCKDSAKLLGVLYLIVSTPNFCTLTYFY